MSKQAALLLHLHRKLNLILLYHTKHQFSSSSSIKVLENMGGSKCSSYANSSGGGNNFNLPRCGCNTPMKLLISNTGLNPKRKFWKCRNGIDGCDNLVWDDELDEVEAANPKSRSLATCCSALASTCRSLAS
ncbi:hypothetical protein P8452_29077 [Trifolium repens]|nr:hypothetical protein P8452_29077 [Trifolium repens]